MFPFRIVLTNKSIDVLLDDKIGYRFISFGSFIVPITNVANNYVDCICLIQT